MSNRLTQASSPYLQQHADNPVDWWEWSSEALAVPRYSASSRRTCCVGVIGAAPVRVGRG